MPRRSIKDSENLLPPDETSAASESKSPKAINPREVAGPPSLEVTSGSPLQPDENENSCFDKTVPVTAAAVSADQEPASELEGRQIGRFLLQKVIARGGTGTILRSWDTDLRREVAIKLLSKTHAQSPRLSQQFLNEAGITGRLQHPGIIPIYESGKSWDDRPYFAMKLVDGQTLAELLAARDTPDDDLPRLLKIFEGVCQTLSYTHSSGVIHLDIKPSNIMVGAFGEVHVMDWGLARESEGLCEPGDTEDLNHPMAIMNAAGQQDSENEGAAGTVWGTPSYMSPEQARGQCLDVRSDVFGIGGILCEILTGRPPYEGTKLVDVCLKAAQGKLDYAYSNLDHCGADGVLVRLAKKCLAPHPDARPLDARDVARELTLYLESLLHRAESDLERFFELSLDLFCIAGTDGYFRRVNSNFPRVLGYSEKDLLARPFLEFVHPDDVEQTVAVMGQLRDGNPVVQFQNRYLASDGSWRCFEWTAKSLPEEGMIFAVARDITDGNRRTD